MDIKHDAIIAVSDEGETFILEIITKDGAKEDSIIKEIGIDLPEIEQKTTRPGLYYAKFRYEYCGGESCNNLEIYKGKCECRLPIWVDLTPIYQLPTE